MIYRAFLTILFSFNSYSFNTENLDQKIKEGIKRFQLSPLKPLKNDSPQLYQLGKKLFSDPLLSMQKNISCLDCHNPSTASSDALPLGFGEGSFSRGNQRFQGQARVMKRNAPALFNLGNSSLKSAFWDGRIIRNEVKKTYITPDPNFERNVGRYQRLNKEIKSIIGVQALFPIISNDEMRGTKHDHLSNIEVWDKVVKRIKLNPKYKGLIKSSFSISTLANSLAYFQKIAFQTPDTRWDYYLQGKSNSLSLQEKRGALIFIEKGRCANCHNGALLSNHAFQNIAAPQVLNLDSHFKDDLGRFEAFNDKRFIYSFRTMPLRNIALSAPYTHSGAFLNLKQLIEHYNNIPISLERYSTSVLNKKYQNHFNKSFYYQRNGNQLRISRLSPPVRSPLSLSITEKKDLECFLVKSLTQIKLLSTKLAQRSCRPNHSF